MARSTSSAAVDRAKRSGVLATAALDQRARRVADFAAENEALHSLAHALTTSAGAMLRELARLARELCGATLAGIDLIENAGGTQCFHCKTLDGGLDAGALAAIPADDSPDGLTLELGTSQLFAYPKRHFTTQYAQLPDVVEQLVVPIPGLPEPWGTLWVMSCDKQHRFDAEHRRILTGLANFTCAALAIARAESEARRHALAAEAANHALALAEEHKDNFIATLGHELRNPLTPIEVELKVLRKVCNDNGTALSALDVADRQIAQLRRLVDDLLDLSRMRHGKLSMHRSCALLQDIVGDAVRAVKVQADHRQQRLAVNLPPYPVHVYADAARVIQILTNLLTNSVKYTPPGGEIDVSVKAPDIGDRPVPHTDCEEVVITVRDNGLGITPALQPYVFNMFSQSASARTRAEGGLGIGLAVVKYLVDAHHGDIDISSDGEGKGTRVVVRLPIACARPSGQDATPAPAVAPLRLLVVDDNADAAEALGTLLELDGHDVRRAQSGAEALLIVETFTPDVALIDLAMPGMGGAELARLLRERVRCSMTRFVAVTGYSQGEGEQTTCGSPFDYRLIKPISLNDLADILR
ncbi:hybrid sensor histidine kinase/response regulator [Paraburkholderia oxyphila]|uniref:hybrid sensor histidine kinase/response regulator n=1 Tax=Paraburkholderia oxyphila TaxID=614212 RepID=UPI0004837057|nr:hybrid sensor histidine kinase/response regulator [Paraburkholderia oxyphila]